MNETFDLPGTVLRLTLAGKPFQMMLTGEKPDEYRQDSAWIRSRLEGKNYDWVAFYHGPYTGGNLPWFACPFKGYTVAPNYGHVSFSNGLEVDIVPGMHIIHLGPVVASGNLK